MNNPEKQEATPKFDLVGRDSWISSLREQLRQLSDERRHPRPQVELTSQQDPSALRNLVDTQSSFLSLIGQVRVAIEEWRNPSERFEATATPVDVDEIWTHQNRTKASAISVAAHIVVGLLLIFPFVLGPQQTVEMTETFVPLYLPPPLILDLPAEDEQSGGGGGGGLQQETPASQGELPRAAEEQIVPPTPEPPNPDPILVAEPTIVAPQLARIQPPVNLALLGVPSGIPGPPSAGPGIGGGIGDGQGRGVGEGEGPGFGEGEGGGTGGGVFSPGGGISQPTILYREEPEYSEEARRARHQGTVIIEGIVRTDGSVDILGVVRGLGFGLDEKAIEALRLWRFNPAMRNGQPVDVKINFEINFTLR